MSGFSDGGWQVQNLGGVTRWKLPFFNTFMNFSGHHLCCFIVASLFVLDKSTTWNRCLQHPDFRNLCKITRTSKIFIFQHPTLPFGFANTCMISLHALYTPRLPSLLYCHEQVFLPQHLNRLCPKIYPITASQLGSERAGNSHCLVTHHSEQPTCLTAPHLTDWQAISHGIPLPLLPLDIIEQGEQVLCYMPPHITCLMPVLTCLVQLDQVEAAAAKAPQTLPRKFTTRCSTYM